MKECLYDRDYLPHKPVTPLRHSDADEDGVDAHGVVVVCVCVCVCVCVRETERVCVRENVCV